MPDPGLGGAVREHPARLRERDDSPVERAVVGCRDHEAAAVEVRFLETPGTKRKTPFARELRRVLAGLGRHHAHPGPGRDEHFGLPGPDPSRAHHEAGPAVKVQEDGQLLHRDSVPGPLHADPQAGGMNGHRLRTERGKAGIHERESQG